MNDLYVDRISQSEMQYLYKWAVRHEASMQKKKRCKKIKLKQKRAAFRRRKKGLA